MMMSIVLWDYKMAQIQYRKYYHMLMVMQYTMASTNHYNHKYICILYVEYTRLDYLKTRIVASQYITINIISTIIILTIKY